MKDLQTDIRSLIEGALETFYEYEADEFDSADQVPEILFYGIHCMYDLDHHELVIQVSSTQVSEDEVSTPADYWLGDDFNADYQSEWSPIIERICMAAYDRESPGEHVDRVINLIRHHAIDILDEMQVSGKLKQFGFCNQPFMFHSTLDDNDSESCRQFLLNRRNNRTTLPTTLDSFQ